MKGALISLRKHEIHLAHGAQVKWENVCGPRKFPRWAGKKSLLFPRERGNGSTRTHAAERRSPPARVGWRLEVVRLRRLLTVRGRRTRDYPWSTWAHFPSFSSLSSRFSRLAVTCHVLKRGQSLTSRARSLSHQPRTKVLPFPPLFCPFPRVTCFSSSGYSTCHV